MQSFFFKPDPVSCLFRVDLAALNPLPCFLPLPSPPQDVPPPADADAGDVPVPDQRVQRLRERGQAPGQQEERTGKR